MDKQVMGVVAAAYTLLLATEVVSDVPCGQELLDRMRDCLANAYETDADTAQAHYGALAQTIRYAAPEMIEKIMGSLLKGNW